MIHFNKEEKSERSVNSQQMHSEKINRRTDNSSLKSKNYKAKSNTKTTAFPSLNITLVKNSNPILDRLELIEKAKKESKLKLERELEALTYQHRSLDIRKLAQSKASQYSYF